MIKNVPFVCRLILGLVVIFLIGCFIYFYVIKTIKKAKDYSYKVVEMNMQESMNSYLLSDYESFVAGIQVKLKLSDLIKDNYLKKSSIPSECNVNTSYIMGTVKKGKISYKTCLICDNYKSKDC